MFTCSLNATDSKIADNDLQWYRFIRSTGTTVLVDQHGDSINFITNTTGNKINSSLTIMDIRTSHNGYFWVEMPYLNTCYVYLTVGKSMYACEYIIISYVCAYL